MFSGEASIHPRGSHDAQESDGGGRTQTQTGRCGGNFRLIAKETASIYLSSLLGMGIV